MIIKRITLFLSCLLLASGTALAAFANYQEAMKAGDGQRKAGKFAEARAAYAEALLLAEPGELKSAAQLAVADTLMRDKQPDRALDAYAGISTIPGSSMKQQVEALIGMGDICRGRGDYAGARKNYAAALKTDGIDIYRRRMAHLRMADLYRVEGEYNMAREEYDRALQIPGLTDINYRAPLYLNIADTYLDEKKAAEAREAYKAVMLLEKAPPAIVQTAEVGMARSYLLDGDFDRAIAECRQLLQRQDLTYINRNAAERALSQAGNLKYPGFW